MDSSLTQIAVVLDRSGSMDSVITPTINNFNEFVRQQHAVPGSARLRLAQFDHEYELLYDKPIGEVEKLTEETFRPRGNTALLDAIGRTIDSLGDSLAAMPEEERPGKVIVLILTDGQENYSSLYSRQKIRAMIRHQREKYSWEFIFMGTTWSSVLDAKSYGICTDSIFMGHVADTKSMLRISNHTRSLRTGGKA